YRRIQTARTESCTTLSLMSCTDVLLPQPGNQVGRLVPYQTSKGPTGETHVRVDYHTRYPFFCRMGVNRRRMFPPRINLFAESGMSAPRHISRLSDNAVPFFQVSSCVGDYTVQFAMS